MSALLPRSPVSIALAATLHWKRVFKSFHRVHHLSHDPSPLAAYAFHPLVYPRGFLRSPLGWIFNTTTHHHQHHRKTNWNFGLYFNVWDRLLGTNHPEYASAYAAVTERPSESEQAPAVT